MVDEAKTKVGLDLTHEMTFKCDLGEMALNDCYIDELHKNEAEMWGPNPSRLLALAITGCLSASFVFCLQKRNLKIEDLHAEAEVFIARNEKGFWRVKKIVVDIEPVLDSPELKKRAENCKKMFEDYCIVTQSVREGLDIDVNMHL